MKSNSFFIKRSRINSIRNLSLSFTLVLACIGCNDDRYENPPAPKTDDGIYISCEGLWNSGSSTLAYYSFTTDTLTTDFFKLKNNRVLGNGANDLQLYGGKLYSVLTTSNILEVMNASTGASIKQVKMLGENNVGREPRQIAFHKNKAYVCSFDGTVVRIDTTSLNIEAVLKVGLNPDGICVANDTIYVSNSGGLNAPAYDNTVSVIDPSSFKELKRISVAANPNTIQADSQGDLYLASYGSDKDPGYRFQRIKAKTHEVEIFDNMGAQKFVIHKDTAYLFHYDYSSKKYWIKVFDCRTESIISDNFITDNTELITPHGIGVNPYNGDVYITDALGFIVEGSVYCFDNKGKLKFKLSQVGPIPSKLVFVRK